MAAVYLCLGSNLGDRAANLRKTLALIEKAGIKVEAKSSIYETEPYGIKNQPFYLNGCIKTAAGLQPEEMLNKLKEIEVQAGRIPGPKWGARIIDIDILFYDNIIIRQENLIIPHPEIQNRRFVLAPLCEIARDYIHPVLKKTVKQLIDDLKADETAAMIGAFDEGV